MNCSKNLAITINQSCVTTDLVWGAPFIEGNAMSTGSGSNATAFASCDGLGPIFSSETVIVGTMVYTGPESIGALEINAVILSGDNVALSVSLTSSIDGDLVLASLTEADSPGLYSWPFVIPSSVGAILTATINLITGNIDNPGETGFFTGSFNFCAS